MSCYIPVGPGKQYLFSTMDQTISKLNSHGWQAEDRKCTDVELPENWGKLAETIPPITFLKDDDTSLRSDYNNLVEKIRLLVKLHIRNHIGGDCEYDSVVSDLVEMI